LEEVVQKFDYVQQKNSILYKDRGFFQSFGVLCSSVDFGGFNFSLGWSSDSRVDLVSIILMPLKKRQG
jgi:hypothetical protein